VIDEIRLKIIDEVCAKHTKARRDAVYKFLNSMPLSARKEQNVDNMYQSATMYHWRKDTRDAINEGIDRIYEEMERCRIRLTVTG
jgi:hypothetical protein